MIERLHLTEKIISLIHNVPVTIFLETHYLTLSYSIAFQKVN